MMKKLMISIVIPVYNEEKVISKCLESLKEQTIKSKEIIVVDDGSTDKTIKEISKIQVTGYRLQVVRQEHKGAGAARNFGVSKATGDVLVFVDADMRFHPTFLEELTKPIRKGISKGTFSKLEYIANWNNRWARFWNYWRGLYEPIAVPKNFPDRSPVFRAILRNEFQRIGGFDETAGYNDDWSLSKKLGYEATETPARFYHDNPSSLREVFLQARWSAKRQYRYEEIGFLLAFIRAFPLWAAPFQWSKIWNRRVYLADSAVDIVFFSFVFFCIVQIGVAFGIIEFALMNDPKK